MRCWMCADREEHSDFGLCGKCRDELHAEILIPPGKSLHATGTLPEAIGPYRVPVASDFVTTPT